jgi:hypothetical protein
MAREGFSDEMTDAAAFVLKLTGLVEMFAAETR